MPSFSIPLSGLSAMAAGIDAVGNNLANLNTTGYKTDTVSFEDIAQQVLGSGTSGSTGMGVTSPIIRHAFTQGSVQSSSGSLDAGIQGDGFFVVKNSSGVSLYTRAGSFRLDGNGNLVTATGEKVQGWNAAGGTISPSGAASDILITPGALTSPLVTQNFSVAANLNASAATDSTFSTPMQVVDSLGNTHTLNITFKKTGDGAWSYDVSIPGEDLSSGTAGTPESVGNGTLTFDSSGKLTAPDADTPGDINIAGLTGGAADMEINFNFYGTDGTPLLTQYTQDSAVSRNSQDGVVSAQSTGIKMGDGGKIVAQFSNGTTKVVAQLALASIGNPDSMTAIGNNNFQLGADSMMPVIGAADTGGRGKIVGGALEASTVDIAKEFTNLMTFQRSYQASSRVITTIDELTQEALTIKR